MAHRRLIVIVGAILGIGASTAAAAAATLKAKTVAGWTTYVQATEKRIEGELAGNSSKFLILDFKSPEEKERIRKVLKSGAVYVEKMETKDARGKEIQIEDGMIHHWYGSIFVPNVKLQTLRRWLQDYDRHADYFDEVEKS